MSSGTIDIPDISAETPVETVRDLIAAAEIREAMTPDQLMIASEIAYRAGDYRTGIDALTTLIAKAPTEGSYVNRLGVFQRLAGDRTAAEHSFRRALALDPTIEGAYHELRELLLGRDDVDEALALLDRQESELGNSQSLRLARASLLRRSGRIDAALEIVRPLALAGDAPEHVLRLMTELTYELRRFDEAMRYASLLLAGFPETRSHRVLFAHLLCASGRFDEAVPLLRELLSDDPDDTELLRLLSTALAEKGQYQAALETAIRTTEINPHSAEFWYHASALANILGQPENALEWIEHALALDPNNLTLLLARVHILVRFGRLNDAIAALDRAREKYPSDKNVQDLRLMLLARIGEEFVVSEHRSDLIKPLPMSRTRPEYEGSLQSLAEGARIQSRVILALVMREMEHRTVHSRFGLMSALIEPALQIVMLGVVLAIFNNGRPPIGNNLFFFYSTGVMPFYLMLHVVDHTMNIFTDNAHLLQISRIRRADLVIATALTELLIGGLTTVLIFSLFFAFGYGETLDNISTAVFAYVAVWLFAFGVGFIGAVVNNLTKIWQQSWMTVARVLYFLSGIFFIPRMMPDWARDIVVWNPLLVGIEWFRSGLFIDYSPPWIDKPYLIMVSLACILTGAVLERALRRRLRTTP